MANASCTVTIVNRLGLHARPAMAFVDLATGYKSAVTVARGDTPDEKVDGKSIMQMMMLAATRGSVLAIAADGPDAEEAVAALKRLVEGRFGEE